LQNAKIVFYDIKFTSNPSLIANMTASVFNNSDGDSKANFSSTILVDFMKALILYRITPPNFNEQDTNNIIQGSFDPCKVSKGVFGGFIIKMLQQSMEKYSNYRFGCGLKKGFYYTANFNLDDSLLPLHIFGQQLKFVGDFNVKVKTTKQKSMVEAFTIKVTGIAV